MTCTWLTKRCQTTAKYRGCSRRSVPPRCEWLQPRQQINAGVSVYSLCCSDFISSGKAWLLMRDCFRFVCWQTFDCTAVTAFWNINLGSYPWRVNWNRLYYTSKAIKLQSDCLKRFNLTDQEPEHNPVTLYLNVSEKNSWSAPYLFVRMWVRLRVFTACARDNETIVRSQSSMSFGGSAWASAALTARPREPYAWSPQKRAVLMP